RSSCIYTKGMQKMKALRMPEHNAQRKHPYLLQPCRTVVRPTPLYAVMLAMIFSLTLALAVHAGDSIEIPGPDGGESFGDSVLVLPNGNIAVTDPYYDIPGGASDVGAAYLYDGESHAMISMLTGSTADDNVGW